MTLWFRIQFLCHSEFISESLGHEILPHGGQAHKAHISPVRFVKQVQNDIENDVISSLIK